MNVKNKIRFHSIVELWDSLPENERLIADVLKQIILEHLPNTCIEKLAYNPPP